MSSKAPRPPLAHAVTDLVSVPALAPRKSNSPTPKPTPATSVEPRSDVVSEHLRFLLAQLKHDKYWMGPEVRAIALWLMRLGEPARSALVERFSQENPGVALQAWLIKKFLSPNDGGFNENVVLLMRVAFEIGSLAEPEVDLAFALRKTHPDPKAVLQALFEQPTAAARARLVARYEKVFGPFAPRLGQVLSGWQLQKAQALLVADRLTRAQELHFDSTAISGTTVAGVLEVLWGAIESFAGYDALDRDWAAHVHDRGWTTHYLYSAMATEIGDHPQWPVLNALFTAYERIKELRAAENELGGRHTAAGLEEIAGEERRRIATRALVDSADATTRRWAARTLTAQSRQDSSAEEKLTASNNAALRAAGFAGLAARKRSWAAEDRVRRYEQIAASDLPEAQQKRLYVELLDHPSDADWIWAESVLGHHAVVEDLIVRTWTLGRVAAFRRDAATDRTAENGAVLRPRFSPYFVVPFESELAWRRVYELVRPDRSDDIERGAHRVLLEIATGTADADLAGLVAFVEGVERHEKQAGRPPGATSLVNLVVTRFVQDTRAGELHGRDDADRFLALLAGRFDEGKGSHYARLRDLLRPPRTAGEFLESGQAHQGAHRTGIFSGVLDVATSLAESLKGHQAGFWAARKVDRLRFIATATDEQVRPWLELTGAKDRDALAALVHAGFLVDWTDHHGSRLLAASLVAGVFEVAVESVLTAGTGGAGFPAVVASIIATVANFAAQEALLGSEYKAVTEDNIEAVILAGVGGVLFEKVDFRGKFEKLVQAEKLAARLLPKSPTLGKILATMPSNALGAVADSLVTEAARVVLQQALQDKGPDETAMTAAAYRLATAVASRVMLGLTVAWKWNPQNVNDLTPFNTRLLEGVMFKAGYQVWTKLGKVGAELLSGGPLTGPDAAERIATTLLRGLLSSVPKVAAGAIAGDAVARRRRGEVLDYLRAFSPAERRVLTGAFVLQDSSMAATIKASLGDAAWNALDDGAKASLAGRFITPKAAGGLADAATAQAGREAVHKQIAKFIDATTHLLGRKGSPGPVARTPAGRRTTRPTPPGRGRGVSRDQGLGVAAARGRATRARRFAPRPDEAGPGQTVRPSSARVRARTSRPYVDRMAAKYGFPAGQLTSILAFATEHNLRIWLRQGNPASLAHLERGALPKHHLVKAKTIAAEDLHLHPMLTKDHLGLVGYFDPQLPAARPQDMAADVWERVRQRAAQRADEFRDQAEMMSVLSRPASDPHRKRGYDDDLQVRVDNGVVRVVDQQSGATRPIAGDIDAFHVLQADGRALRTTVRDEFDEAPAGRVENRLVELGLSEHGPHLWWRPTSEVDRQIDRKVLESHADGGLLEVSPAGLVEARGSDVPGFAERLRAARAAR